MLLGFTMHIPRHFGYTSGDHMTTFSRKIVMLTINQLKTAIVIVDMWLQACAFDIVSPQHTHNLVEKTCKNGKEYFW